MQYDPLCRIDIYSHFFTVTRFNGRIAGIIYRFTLKYIRYKFVPSRGGAMKREQDKVFGGVNKTTSEFRFHIGQLGPLMKAFENDFIEPEFYEWYVHPLYTPDPIKVKSRESYTLKPDQLEAQRFILSPDNDGDLRTRFIAMPPGTGKAQPLDSLIRVPGGWRRMGELSMFDPVIAANGDKTVVTGIFPQGKRTVASVEFDDGRKVKCDLDHLWKVTNGQHWDVIETHQVKERLKNGEKLYVPLITPNKDEPDVAFPIESDVLGEILRKENIEEGSSKLFKWLIITKMIDSKVLVPEIYQHGSYRQRRGLLRALLGPNNIQNKEGRISVSYRFPGVLESIKKLTQSLGGIALIEADTVHVWNVRAGIFECMDRKLRLTSVQILPEQEECQCIQVAHPSHMYVTDGFIATHNTVVSLVTIAHEQCRTRTLITSLPKYLKKWPQDVLNITHCNKDDIVMVNGGDAVKAVVQMAKEGELHYPFVMISLTTLRNFYRDYYDDPGLTEKVYGCKPQELCAIMGIGQIIIDEAHEDLYGIYQLMIYNHVPKIIGLSGSLISKDPFVLNMQHLMFPTEIRFEEIKVQGFVKSFAISYNFKDFERSGIRTSERGSNSYSHTAFEESLMSRPSLLLNYLKLIASIVEMGYVQDYEDGDRFGIFAARKDMCDVISKYLAQRFPRFNVKRYIQGDPYENLIESDIRVTTVLSGGTAHDIPKLRGFLMTNNLDSVTGNVQAIGRLRHPDKAKVKDVKYYWIFCEQIPKHVSYHRSRMELLRDRVQFTKEFRSEIVI